MPTTAYAITVKPPVEHGYYVPVQVSFELASAPGATPNRNPAYATLNGTTPLDTTTISDATTFYFESASAVNVKCSRQGDDDAGGAWSLVPLAYASPAVVTCQPASGGVQAPELTSLASDDRWIPADRFLLNFGSPTLDATTHGLPAWLLDAAATEVVATTEFIPTGWITFNMDMWWSNASSGSGNVVANVRYGLLYDASNATGGEVNLGNTTLAAPAQNIIKVTTVASGIYRPADGVVRINVRRVGGDASDTLANDASFLGIRLRRAT